MNETSTVVFILVGCEFNIKLLGIMGQKLLFLYRICADTMYMPYLQALLSESVKLKLMFSQYESGREWYKYIRSNSFIFKIFKMSKFQKCELFIDAEYNLKAA